MDRQVEHDTTQPEAPLSERLRQIAEQKKTAWPEDEYVPHEDKRGRNVAAESIAQGAMLGGGLGRM